MSDIQSLDRLREHAAAALAPFFLEDPTEDISISDPNGARSAAAAILADYAAATPKELQLSAQIIALGWASLACLRTAVAAKNLSVQEILGLQDTAIALDRASHKTTRTLEARRKDRSHNPRAMTLEKTRWDEGVFQLTINQALDKMNDANAKLAAYMETLTPGQPVQHTALAAQSKPDRRARE